MKSAIAMAFAGVLLAACTSPGAAPASEMPAAQVAADMFDYAAVFGQDDRPAQDYEMYAVRKSADVLAFTGVKPGMSVVEMEAGDGFYTELLSRVVGEEGRIYMQNPPSFASFLGDSVAKRVHGRLNNVTIVESAFDNLTAVPDGEADLVTWFLGPHELWYTPEGEPEGALGDPDLAFEEIARVLKPSGSFVVLDHMAPPGSPPTTGGDTHRIDKAYLISLAEAHGFTLVSESGILAHPEDDGTVNVFDPSVRRKTDRFLLKFTR